jgi:hypothetical protein
MGNHRLCRRRTYPRRVEEESRPYSTPKQQIMCLRHTTMKNSFQAHTIINIIIMDSRNGASGNSSSTPLNRRIITAVHGPIAMINSKNCVMVVVVHVQQHGRINNPRHRDKRIAAAGIKTTTGDADGACLLTEEEELGLVVYPVAAVVGVVIIPIIRDTPVVTT